MHKLDKAIQLLQQMRNSYLQIKNKHAIIPKLPAIPPVISKQKENIMSTTKTPKELAQQLISAENSNSAGKKAAATRAINQYVESKVKAGSDEKRIRAGVKAVITNLRNN